MPGLQIPARPEREPRAVPLPKRGGGGPRSGARSSARRACRTVPGDIAPGQSQPGAVQLDRRREAAEFLLVGDDHLRRRDLRSLTAACRWFQPPFGVPQPALDSLELADSQQRPGKANAEHGPDTDQFVGEHLEPATQRGLLPGPAHGRDRQLDQVRRSLEIPGGQRVADGLGRLAVLLVPPLARRCRSGTWPGCSSSRRACSTSANRWW